MAPSSRQARFAQGLAALRLRVTEQTTDLLPGERELAGSLGVSRTTVRRMLDQLGREGLVVQRQGVGTFVARATNVPASTSPAPAPAQQPAPVFGLTGWVESLRQRGRSVVLRHEKHDTGWPTLDEAQSLDLDPSHPVHRTIRIWDLDDRPLAAERITRPEPSSSTPAPPAPHVAHTRLIVRRASSAESRDLGIEAGAPVADLRRIEKTARGQACTCATVTVRGDRFVHLWKSGGSDPEWDVAEAFG